MKIPKGIDDRPEQLRPPIYKGKGVTESERYLAHLAEKSFLNLWSYPSPFRDQRKGTKGDGKELCDLLVVCGRHIIIFSEKSIYWPGGDVKVAWCRWARRAIQHAVEQANGAERWLTNFPERVFLDRQCTVPFPIELPSSSDRLIHKVIVTRGAAEPCKTHLGYGNGSLIIEPSIVGDDHWPADPNLAIPFKVGYIDKKGPFVHVLNENSLAIIMEELDTILDFATYLQKKEEFIRSKRLSIAHGEENLLAYYAARMNQNGEHDFVIPSGNASVNIQHHEYVKFKQDMRYKRKKEADKVSYLWDALIETFTSRMLDGTTIIIDDHDFEVKKNEIAVRHMVLLRRFDRRIFSEAIRDAFLESKQKDRFFRVVMSDPDKEESDFAFFILLIKYQDWMDAGEGYEFYRRKRYRLGILYAEALLEKFRHLKRVIGVSREPPNQGRGVSEDLIYVEQTVWTEESRLELHADCARCGILQNMRRTAWHADEFPIDDRLSDGLADPPSMLIGLNRKQRRAMKSKRKNDWARD